VPAGLGGWREEVNGSKRQEARGKRKRKRRLLAWMRKERGA